MDQRLLLHELLVGVLESPNVYFQPPAGYLMKYPAIVYNRDYAMTSFADNNVYNFEKRYEVTVIDRDPDSPIPDKVAWLPRCRFSRHFVVDGLNHDVFTLFF